MSLATMVGGAALSAALTAGGVGLPAARIGDAEFPHIPCSLPMFRMMGSSNVFINGRPASRQFDFNTPHVIKAGKSCVPHIGFLSLGSFSVRINGRGAGRMTDGVFPCTLVAMGSSNVLIGG